MGWLSKYQTGGFSHLGYKSNSPDRKKPFNIIPSNQITMKGVPHPVFGTDDTGHSKLMLPGNDYTFPGSMITEIPMPANMKDAAENGNPLFSVGRFSIGYDPTEQGYFTAGVNIPFQEGGPYKELGSIAYQTGGNVYPSLKKVLGRVGNPTIVPTIPDPSDWFSSEYDPVSNSVYLNKFTGDQDLPHELGHSLQRKLGWLREDDGLPLKKPNMVRTDGDEYYNRKSYDIDDKVDQYKDKLGRDAQFVPEDYLINKANDALYDDPDTAEGNTELELGPHILKDLNKKPNQWLKKYK